MWPLIGLIIVVGSVLGSFVAMGGHLIVLWQPWEFVIILGAGLGGFIIGNKPTVISDAIKDFAAAFGGRKHTKKTYVELLTLLHKLLKTARSKGILELEKHIEDPFQSELFSNYKFFIKNPHAVVFLCDYIRMIMMGGDQTEHILTAMDEEIISYKKERYEVSSALAHLGDSLPAIGIIAAVLGVIKTMSSLSDPPAILGGRIAAALIGTFLGIFLAYGFVSPLARRIAMTHIEEFHYLECIKEALVAHMSGASPPIAVEQARKILQEEVRPTFYELETAIQVDRS